MLYRTVGMIQDAIDDLDKSDSSYYKKMGETMERFAVEASMAKVYGSETSSMVVDIVSKFWRIWIYRRVSYGNAVSG